MHDSDYKHEYTLYNDTVQFLYVFSLSYIH